ncbi:MAG: hypothetical protein WDN46_20865 [Methylocella sp.]
MPNSTIPATDTGSPCLNRRSALANIGVGLAGSASLATLSAAKAQSVSTSPELFRLIEAHRAANMALLQSAQRINVAEKSYNAARPRSIPLKSGSGRFIESAESASLKLSLDAAYRDFDSVSDVESEALMPVCSYRCATLQEARAKARYLSTLDDLDMRPQFLTAFVQSFCYGDGSDMT